MQIILQGMLVVLWLILVPMLLGTGMDKWYYHTIRYGRSYLFGTLFMWATFEVIAVPAIFFRRTLKETTCLWGMIIGICMIVSLICLIRTKEHSHIQQFKEIWNKIKKAMTKTKVIWFVFGVLVFLQASIYVWGVHTDWDDSRFVSNAVAAYNRGTMLQTNPQTGEHWGQPLGEVKKDATSPWMIYVAMLAKLTRIHPTILAHTALPVFLLLLCYLAYYELITAFVSERFYRAVAMVCVSVVMTFGAYSVYADATFILTRIWQGKSVVVAVCMPFLFAHLSQIYESGTGRGFVLLAVINTAACLLSGVGIVLTAAITGTQALSYSVQKKSWKILLFGILTCIPNLIFAIIQMKG